MKFNTNIAGYLLVIKVMLISNTCSYSKTNLEQPASGKGKNVQDNGPASSIANQTTASGKGKNLQDNGPASSIPNQTTASGKGNVQANGPAGSIPNQTTASGKGKNVQDLHEELVKKYYLSEKEMIQKVNEKKQYEVNPQKEYYINLFKGENDPACQKLEKAYAKASINGQMELLVKHYGMDQDYIDRIMQDEEVLIKLRVSRSKFFLPWDLCCKVNQKGILPYLIEQISNKETIASCANNKEQGYLSYIRDQIIKKTSVDQVMTFTRWREIKKPDLVLS